MLSTGRTAARNSTIDIARGLLIVLMINSHALTHARVPASHFLYSDLWLPNGWATSLFVVVSGFAAGFLFAPRIGEPRLRQLLHHRAAALLTVMLVSNALFASSREWMYGDPERIGSEDWWWGFATLETEWTISGVLMPTALMLLLAPVVLAQARRSTVWTLFALIALRLVATLVDPGPALAGNGEPWIARVLFTDGFGGYPIVPYTLDGCLGLCLGVLARSDHPLWRPVMLTLLLMQALIYVGSPGRGLVWQFLFESAAPVARLPWILLVASLLAAVPRSPIARAIGVIGRSALLCFLVHRVALQTLRLIASPTRQPDWAPEIHYLILFSGTFVLTWALARARQRRPAFDQLLRRAYL